MIQLNNYKKEIPICLNCNKELSYEDLRKKARDAYSKLKDVYRTVVEVWFPLTDSDLKDYSKQSFIQSISELATLLNIKVLAENVKNDEDMKFLRKYNLYAVSR